MWSNQLATGSRLEPRVRPRLRFLSIPKRKHKPRALKGGETELLELLGERRRHPREDGLTSGNPPRPRWF